MHACTYIYKNEKVKISFKKITKNSPDIIKNSLVLSILAYLSGKLQKKSKSFEVKFADNVPLTPSNVPPKFRWINQNKFEKRAKMWFQTFKRLPFDEVKINWGQIRRQGAPYS